MTIQQISDPHVNPEPVGSGTGFFLSDERVRRIVSGSVNLFIGGFDESTGAAMGNYQFVAGLEAGELLFPVRVRLESGDVSYRLLAMPLPDTEICQRQEHWIDLVREDAAIRDGFDQFIRNLLAPFALEMPRQRLM